MLKFYGLEQTYYDHPNMYSLVLYTGGCNLKCYGCHNRQLAGWVYRNADKTQKQEIKVSEENQALTVDEVNLAVKNEMLDMIILCGGETLIHPMDQIKQTIEWIKEANPNALIRIDTNGTFPDKVKELVQWGKVDGFAIDIKGPYWDQSYNDQISNVIGVSAEFGKRLYPLMIQSLNIAKQLPYTIYRTVNYPIVKDNEYFDQIKKYVGDNLHKPHYFSSYVEL